MVVTSKWLVEKRIIVELPPTQFTQLLPTQITNSNMWPTQKLPSSIVHLHFSVQNPLFLHYSHSNANQHVVLDFWDLCGQPTQKPPTPPYYIALIHYTLVNDSWLWVIFYDSSLHSRSRNSEISLSDKIVSRVSLWGSSKFFRPRFYFVYSPTRNILRAYI